MRQRDSFGRIGVEKAREEVADLVAECSAAVQSGERLVGGEGGVDLSREGRASRTEEHGAQRRPAAPHVGRRALKCARGGANRGGSSLKDLGREVGACLGGACAHVLLHVVEFLPATVAKVDEHQRVGFVEHDVVAADVLMVDVPQMTVRHGRQQLDEQTARVVLGQWATVL